MHKGTNRTTTPRLHPLRLGLTVFLILTLAITVIPPLATPLSRVTPLLPQQVQAQSVPIIYVDDGATGENDGSDWSDAYTDLQDALDDALDDAEDRNEIWVAAGTYKPTTIISPSISFELVEGVAMFGGFDGTPGTEGDFSVRDFETNLTILSGDIDNDDATNPVTRTFDLNGTNSYHVIVSTNVTSNTILDGFTITAGNARGGSTDNIGGGMLNQNASPTLRNITFSGNQAFGEGGGMYNENGTPLLEDVLFLGNRANNGSGMYNSGSSPTLEQVSFVNNRAFVNGGGMHNEGNSNPTLTNVTFDGNASDGETSSGGAIYNNASSPGIVNGTFVNNSATNDGGGMHNTNNSFPEVRNATFENNDASQGGGIYNNASSVTLLDTDIINNTANRGGGIYNESGSNSTLENVLIEGNSADFRGGGFYNFDSSPVLNNVVFRNNSVGTATNFGGGLYHDQGNFLLNNATFVGNSASGGGGGGIFIENITDSPEINNSIFWENLDDSGTTAAAQISGGSPTVNFSLVQGGFAGTGNINADPQFVDAANGDLWLSFNSPAIDAGDNSRVPAFLTTDLDGNPRLSDIPGVPDTGSGTPPIVDMGAYELQSGGVRFTETDGETRVGEMGNTDTYSVVLTLQPTQTVNISITTQGQVAITPTVLTFTPSDWNITQTVTVEAVDDQILEGEHSDTINHTLTSADVAYDGLVLPTVTAVITDNDTSDLLLAETGGSTFVNEYGRRDSYTLALASQPTQTVTVDVVVSDTQQVRVITDTLTFEPATWNVSQTVTLLAQDDNKPEDPLTTTVRHRTSSTSPPFDNLVVDLTVNVGDDDIVGVSVVESGNLTEVDEDGSSDGYLVSLNTEPEQDVTISLTHDSQITANPGILTFTPQNWSETQIVTVQAVDNNTVQASLYYSSTIWHVVSSADPDYDAIEVKSVWVGIFDDEGDYSIPLPDDTRNEVEPNDNDDPAHRNTIGPDDGSSQWTAAVKGRIDSPDDTDWYVFELTEPGSFVAITLGDLPADYDLVLGRIDPFPLESTVGLNSGLREIMHLGSSARGSSARGSSARGSSARGSSARGSSARGSSARGSSARGSSARGSSARGSSARGSSARGSSARSGQMAEIYRRSASSGGSITSISMTPGQDDEWIDTTLWVPGTYYVAVVSNNGEFSDAPEDTYTLLVELFGSGLQQPDEAPLVRFPPDVVPPDDTVNTMFVVNPERMRQLYPDQETEIDDMLLRIGAIAQTGDINGVVFRLDAIGFVGGETWEDMYAEWDAQPSNPFLANRIAQSIDNVISAATLPNQGGAGGDPPYPNIRYIVLVGNDLVLPFARVPDLTWLANQGEYYDYLDRLGVIERDSALGGSLDYETILTDNIYSNDRPYNWPEFPMYIPEPDRSVGRLVETPREILDYLNPYALSDPELRSPLVIDGSEIIDGALVSGYDFFADQTLEVERLLNEQGFRARLLIDGDPYGLWSFDDLVDFWFDDDYDQFRTPPYTVRSPFALQSIDAHFSHFDAIPADADRDPTLPTFPALAIQEPEGETQPDTGLPQLYFHNRLIYSMGCNAGLPVDENGLVSGVAPLYLADFPQAIMAQGGNFMGNTSYAYGDDEILAYSERLSIMLTEELGREIKDSEENYIGQPLGIALSQAKNRYVNNLTGMDVLDVKTLMQTTLYGLPFLRVKVPNPQPIPAEDLETAETADQPPLNSFGVTERVITVTVAFTRATTLPGTGRDYPEITNITIDDSFIQGNETAIVPRLIEAGQESAPLLPQISYDITALNLEGDTRLSAKSVWLTDSSFLDIEDYKPKITAVITRTPVIEDPIFPQSEGIAYPELPYQLTNTGSDDEKQDNLVLTLAQYQSNSNDGKTGTMRLYETMVVHVLYIDPSSPDAGQVSADENPPVIERVVVDDGIALRNAGLAQTADTTVIVEVSEGDENDSGLPEDGVKGIFSRGVGDWSQLDFQRTDTDGTTERWEATIAGTNNRLRFEVIAVDQAGNVSYYNGKGTYNPRSAEPVVGVTLAGPDEVIVGRSFVVTATATPATATRPIQYAWTPEPGSGAGEITATYTLTSTGLHTISVRVRNVTNRSGVEVSTPLVVNVLPAPVAVGAVAIIGPAQAEVGSSFVVTATIAPDNATEPITYTWLPEPLSGQGTISATYNVSRTGTFSITVQAANAGNPAGVSSQTPFVVDIVQTAYRVYLPYIRK